MSKKQKFILISIILAALIITSIIIYIVQSGLYLDLISREYFGLAFFLAGIFVFIILLGVARFHYKSPIIPKIVRPYAGTFYLLLGIFALLISTLQGMYIDSKFISLIFDIFEDSAVISIILMTFLIWYLKKRESKKSAEVDQ